MKFQHKIPVRADDPSYHEEEPWPKKFRKDKRYLCLYCNEPLVRVDENEGPESLKALLRF